MAEVWEGGIKAIGKMKMKGDREDETQNERCHCANNNSESIHFSTPSLLPPFSSSRWILPGR